MINRPTTEFTLRSGWKVTLADYFTQGEFDLIQKVMLDNFQYDPETNKMLNTAKGGMMMEQINLAKQLAIKKLVDPSGAYTYEGSSLTMEEILGLPYDPQGDELKDLIDTHTSGKKKATDVPSTAS